MSASNKGDDYMSAETYVQAGQKCAPHGKKFCLKCWDSRDGEKTWARAADAQQVGGDDRRILHAILDHLNDSIAVCERCHHSEPTSDMDVASDLRAYLNGQESWLAKTAALTSPAKVGGDPAEPRDDSDREYTKPVGYLPAYELTRLHSGHDANLRSAKFGPSALDGDVPVYLQPAKVGGDDPTGRWAKLCETNREIIEQLQAQVERYKTRAALAADGGEDKRDAERYRVVRLTPTLVMHYGLLEGGSGLDERCDVAIAANQAKGMRNEAR